ncbi:hypothetical protein Ddye_006310 [Dipteronia dyeriana]|uniref:Uncharacterized protein n=1 Tax=Dipteronia dyeriana TaxID=168575 RepID=A0AAD9XIC8_9ROSI|nr:hypothetical protein Ddye_006310 [Dipteronia dyeriana]
MDDSTILIYNVPLAQVIAKLKGHSEGITGLAFSSALNIMVSSGEDTQISFFLLQISLWNVPKWEKQKCKFLQIPDEKMQVILSATYVQFHQDQTRFLLVNETQLAICEAKELKCLQQWTPVGPVISQATFSCDSQMVFAGFMDGTIFVFDASKLELKCTVGCVIEAYPNAIASHPQKPTQFAVGLTDGTVIVIEPQEPEGKWFVQPPDDVSVLQPPSLPERSGLTKPMIE